MANTLSSKKSIRVGLRRNKVNTKATDVFKKARKAVKDQLSKNNVEGKRAFTSSIFRI